MSHYAVFKTNIREAEHLATAIRQMGYPNVAINAKPMPLQGYGGSQGQSAEIIIPKADLIAKHGHCYGDIGFVRELDGTYRAIIDDLDKDKMDGKEWGQPTPKTTWMDKLTATYTEQSKMAWGIAQGYVFQGREEIETADGPVVNLLFAERD